MVRIDSLKDKIIDSGMTLTSIAKRSNISRVTLHNRLNGVGEFSASEILGLTNALHLTKSERDYIFLEGELRNTQH